MDELNEAPLRARTAALRESCSAVDLEAALRESHRHPVLLFKHSRGCPVSHEALDQLLWHLQFRNAPISSYDITVQTHSKTCEALTRILGVRHETPQAILVAAGCAVWHSAHDKIAAEALASAVNIAGGSGLKGEDRRPPRREEPDDDDDEAPETPLDEPAPTPVQDPPDEPDKGPYTVSDLGWGVPLPLLKFQRRFGEAHGIRPGSRRGETESARAEKAKAPRERHSPALTTGEWLGAILGGRVPAGKILLLAMKLSPQSAEPPLTGPPDQEESRHIEGA